MVDLNSPSRTRKHFGFIHFSILLLFFLSVSGQQLNLFYSSDFFLLPLQSKIMIPVKKSQMSSFNPNSTNYLKVKVKVQLPDENGTYIDAPFQTGNILVKYWKNQQNTPATSILTHSYQSISSTTRFKLASDPSDQGTIDIQALHNYENEHGFMHTLGGQLSDTLFVIGVYRFSEEDLTTLLGMSDEGDMIKVSISVYKGVQADFRCAFCSVKTFCPTNQCECYQETYSDCRVKRRSLSAKVDNGSKVTDSSSLKSGTTTFIQIQPDTLTKQWFTTSIFLNFTDSNTSHPIPIKPQRIYLLLLTQSRSQPSYMIPSIYNYDIFDSPSLLSQITSSSVMSPHIRRLTVTSGVNMEEKIVLSKNQFVTVGIYYLGDGGGAVGVGQVDEVAVVIDMSFDVQEATGEVASFSLAFVIGMIALGFFILLFLICLLHFLVAKRFTFFSIFMNSQTSQRHSMYDNRPRSTKISNLSQQQATTLPQISFDFIKQLVFKPLKYITLTQPQQKLIKKANQTGLTSHDEICSICLQEFTPQSRVKYTYCGHILDAKCLDSWFQKELSCPMCRQTLQAQDVSEYEDRIMVDVWENQHYQAILDEEIEVITKVYKEWENGKKVKGSEMMKYTEESLVGNGVGGEEEGKNGEGVIQNVSTIVEFEREGEAAGGNKDTRGSQQLEMRRPHLQASSLELHPSHQNPSTLPTWLPPIFTHNPNRSIRRLTKIYRFYRCIYLYHKLNKKFQKDSNMFEPSLFFEEKESFNSREVEFRSEDMRENRREVFGDGMGCKGEDNVIVCRTPKRLDGEGEGEVLGTREFMVRSNGQQVTRRQHVEGQSKPQFDRQVEEEGDFGTQAKLKSTQSIKDRSQTSKNNRYARAAFNFDFEFHQIEHPSPKRLQKPQTQQHSQTFPSKKPSIIFQDSINPTFPQSNSIDISSNSHTLKLSQLKRTKCLSLRQEMDGLQRELQPASNHPHLSHQPQNLPNPSQPQQARFRQHSQMIYYLEEQQENARYMDAPIDGASSALNVESMRYRENGSSFEGNKLPPLRSKNLSGKHIEKTGGVMKTGGKKSALSDGQNR